MKYAYENLSDKQFEALVILICQRLLGIGVQGFSDGPDGGRDAKFVGTAELHPSKSSPWTGTTIVQAKHTIGYNCTFSDSDFYSAGSAACTIAEELPRIRALRAGGNLDNCILFSNRRLAGNAESIIRRRIATECGIPEESIHLCGLEHLELLLDAFPEIVGKAALDPIDGPLIITSEDLAEVVTSLVEHKAAISNEPPRRPVIGLVTKIRMHQTI
ncbi:hypothetical protein [Lacipirellula parvula]|uniref:Uncharacterized protein n=1 Tax=Lacipirellula parvula TaxID=2650471 RepID=A0A5K7X4M6_9BACT|nr:hypothetical protein [Lacipirellula parvula]BBO30762.1 hypothetical protein PLANPX_0374 [Lacipirellula parvula]